jgi:hypothetical protein
MGRSELREVPAKEVRSFFGEMKCRSPKKVQSGEVEE